MRKLTIIHSLLAEVIFIEYYIYNIQSMYLLVIAFAITILAITNNRI
jgi:hypothetical protein